MNRGQTDAVVLVSQGLHLHLHLGDVVFLSLSLSRSTIRPSFSRLPFNHEISGRSSLAIVYLSSLCLSPAGKLAPTQLLVSICPWQALALALDVGGNFTRPQQLPRPDLVWWLLQVDHSSWSTIDPADLVCTPERENER